LYPLWFTLFIDEEEQNIIPLIFASNVYYYLYKDVQAGTELLSNCVFNFYLYKEACGCKLTFWSKGNSTIPVKNDEYSTMKIYVPAWYGVGYARSLKIDVVPSHQEEFTRTMHAPPKSAVLCSSCHWSFRSSLRIHAERRIQLFLEKQKNATNHVLNVSTPNGGTKENARISKMGEKENQLGDNSTEGKITKPDEKTVWKHIDNLVIVNQTIFIKLISYIGKSICLCLP